MEKLARGLARAEEGRKRELGGGSGDGGGHVGRRRRSGIGAARLGFVREGEWRGRVKTPLGEANGEGEFGRIGRRRRASSARARPRGGVLAA